MFSARLDIAMKRFSNLFLSLSLLTGVSFAHVLDGEWISEREVKQGAQTLKMSQTFVLKAVGKKLTGSVIVTINGETRPPIEIRDGKVEGKKFSFHTVAVSQMGNLKSAYQGVVEGGMIKGTTTRGGPSAPFDAKRK